MSNYTNPLYLLSQKYRLFFELESLTDNMSLLEVGALIESMDRRTKLLEEISLLDVALKDACEADSALQKALNHQCNKRDLSPELAKFYDISLSIKAIIMRIQNNDENIRAHLDFEKKRIISKLEQINHSGGVVANSYHRSMNTGRQLSKQKTKKTFI